MSPPSPERPARLRAWLAAFLLYLALGQVQAFTALLAPLTRLIGLDHVSPEDWRPAQLHLIVPAALGVLGLSAALLGRWVERIGARRAIVVAAFCFAVGLILAGVGAHRHALWLVYLGYAGLAGIGLGVGYLAPLPGLIDGFPGRRGLALGTALAGFSAGGLVAAPLAGWLLHHFRSTVSLGVMETLATMGVIYFMLMVVAAIQLPSRPMRSDDRAGGAARFPALWVAAFLGIAGGILGLAHARALLAAAYGEHAVLSQAGLLGLLACGDVAGRALWAAVSDHAGRGPTLAALWIGAALLLAGLALFDREHPAALLGACALLAFACGGVAAVLPLYAFEICGRCDLGARLGRLLGAWGAAALAAPLLAGLHPPQGHMAGFGTAGGLVLLALACLWAVRQVK